MPPPRAAEGPNRRRERQPGPRGPKAARSTHTIREQKGRSMTSSQIPRPMPKPKPPVLTPEQKARAIDLRNEQAGTVTVQAPKAAPKPTGGAR